MRPCSPYQIGSEWFVATTANKSILAGPFSTNAEAWRWIDRQTGQPVSRAEDKAEWVWNRMAESAR